MSDINTPWQANALAAVIREVDGGHSLASLALADAIVSKGVRAKQLPEIEIDDPADRVIKTPSGKSQAQTSQVRLSQCASGDTISVTSRPADLQNQTILHAMELPTCYAGAGMTDPAVEAARRADSWEPDIKQPDKFGEMVTAAREMAKSVQELHRPVAYVNRQRCCLTCWDNNGKPHLWPCETAKRVYPSEELNK